MDWLHSRCCWLRAYTKDELVEMSQTQPCSLNGHVAKVCRPRADCATVLTVDGALKARYDWFTIEEVLTTDGKFWV